VITPQKARLPLLLLCLLTVAQGLTAESGLTTFAVSIPAGSFVLGTDAPRQSPPTPTTVDGFDITPTEITVAQYRAFSNATQRALTNGCFDWLDGRFTDDKTGNWTDNTSAPSESHPVVCVSFDDATAYARWLSEQTGESWRLATEAEWEYAAKAGNPQSQPLENSPETACDYANINDLTAKEADGPALPPVPCYDGAVKTGRVGSYQANRFGLHDTLGNVSEWTASCWRDRHDAENTQCGRRVVRGGAWKDDLLQASTTSRVGLPTSFRSRYFGFRLVRIPDKPHGNN